MTLPLDNLKSLPKSDYILGFVESDVWWCLYHCKVYKQPLQHYDCELHDTVEVPIGSICINVPSIPLPEMDTLLLTEAQYETIVSVNYGSDEDESSDEGGNDNVASGYMSLSFIEEYLGKETFRHICWILFL